MKTTNFILLFAICLFSCTSCAQIKHRYNRKYFSGYIITNYGDTLVGRIKGDQNFTKKVKFIGDNDTLQKKVTINITDIKSMRLNLMVFEKIQVKNKVKLLEKVAFGYYDLFAYHYQRGEVSENRYLLKLNEQTIKVEPKNFKEVMERYLFDCTEIRQKVIAKQYMFDDTMDIFRTYNRWKKNHP